MSTYISFKFSKFQPATVKLNDVRRLWRLGLGVRYRCSLDAGRMLPLADKHELDIDIKGWKGENDLTVLTSPDEIGFSPAATQLIGFLGQQSELMEESDM